jgi:XTP/dITP diphosphohydrolase
MKELIYVTGNPLKFAIAQKALEGTGIILLQKKMDIPEIQSKDVQEIASFSAKWGSDLLMKPLMVSDAGYYIEALNGFPGPFIKFINQWLTAEDILRLMNDKENRNASIKECIAYGEPGQEPVCFLGTFKGTIAREAGKKGEAPINEIFIPDKLTRPKSEISQEERVVFWKQDDAWLQLGEYFESRSDGFS